MRFDLARLLDAPRLEILTFGRTEEDGRILAALPKLPSSELLSGLYPSE